MHTDLNNFLIQELKSIKESGLFKNERQIVSPQQANIKLASKQEVINLCANNYLGLANDKRLIAAAKQALDNYGFGLASVRFICGTQTIHCELEQAIANFLQAEDCILFSSCFDANAAVFHALLTEQDAVISDELNHASIIDGIRLSKAQRFRYANNDMAALEKQLKASSNARLRMIITDGVFSMDGYIANLAAITNLAKQYNAIVAVDDSHAVGLLGSSGRGSAEYCNVHKDIDIYIGTLGKALGGAAGGYIASTKPIISYLRQTARPYLFSNSLSPMIVAASITALDILATEGVELRQRLHTNTKFMRTGLTELGFKLCPGEHPIIPVMLGDAQLAANMAEQLLTENLYLVSFSYPVVPKGKARIRMQISAQHTDQQLKFALEKFELVGKKLGII